MLAPICFSMNWQFLHIAPLKSYRILFVVFFYCSFLSVLFLFCCLRHFRLHVCMDCAFQMKQSSAELAVADIRRSVVISVYLSYVRVNQESTFLPLSFNCLMRMVICCGSAIFLFPQKTFLYSLILLSCQIRMETKTCLSVSPPAERNRRQPGQEFSHPYRHAEKVRGRQGPCFCPFSVCIVLSLCCHLIKFIIRSKSIFLFPTMISPKPCVAVGHIAFHYTAFCLVGGETNE